MAYSLITLALFIFNTLPVLAFPFLVNIFERGLQGSPGSPGSRSGYPQLSASPVLPHPPVVNNVCSEVNSVLSILSGLDATATSFCSSLLDIGISITTVTSTPPDTTTTIITTTTETNTSTTSTTTTTTSTLGAAKRFVTVPAPVRTPPPLQSIANDALSTACSCQGLVAATSTTITTLPTSTDTITSTTTTTTTTTTTAVTTTTIPTPLTQAGLCPSQDGQCIMDNGQAFTVFCNTEFDNASGQPANSLQDCVDLCAATAICDALDWFEGSGNCYFYEGPSGTETSGSTDSCLGLLKADACSS